MTVADVRVSDDAGWPLARLTGAVDLSNVEELTARLEGAVSNRALGLVLDLSGVTYLDSTGLRLIYRLARRLGDRQQSLRLVVEDDGPGLPAAGPRADGHGLLNMRRRAGELNGEVRYEPAPAGGLRVVVRLPLASRFRRVRLPLVRSRHPKHS